MNSQPVDILEESVRIPAGDDVLSGVLAYPFAGRPERGALVVGPHPLMGGRLNNNVVRAVARGLAEQAFLALRFEFGGGGPTPAAMETFWQTGHAPDDPCRADDTRAACAWLRQWHTGPIIAVGYSFGASLLGEILGTGTLTHLVLIGATLAQHDYAAVAASPLPKLLITADNDFATPLAVTRAWFERAAEPKTLVVVPAAEHFYRQQETRLVAEIVQWTQT